MRHGSCTLQASCRVVIAPRALGSLAGEGLGLADQGLAELGQVVVGDTTLVAGEDHPTTQHPDERLLGIVDGVAGVLGLEVLLHARKGQTPMLVNSLDQDANALLDGVDVEAGNHAGSPRVVAGLLPVVVVEAETLSRELGHGT